MSPPQPPRTTTDWAAVLQKARNDLGIRSHMLIPLVRPKQGVNVDQNPSSLGIKKKGKPQKKGKKKWQTLKIDYSLAESDSHTDIIDVKFDKTFDFNFKKPVTWHSREIMKLRAEKRYPKAPVYAYSPLPKDFQIYENLSTLSKEKKRRIICGHRFHEKHELERIPENRELFWMEPRRARVEADPIIQEKKRQGPMAVEPAPVLSKAGGSSWSQVAAKPKTVMTGEEVPVGASMTRPAAPKVPVTSTKPLFKKIPIKPPPRDRNTQKTGRKYTHSRHAQEEKFTDSERTSLQRNTSITSRSIRDTQSPNKAPCQLEGPRGPQPKPGISCLRRKSRPNSVQASVTLHVVAEAAAPIKAPVKAMKRVSLVASKGSRRT